MEFNSEFCPFFALFGFLLGFGWCMFTSCAQVLFDYFLERKKIKRLRRESLKICPFCGSYVGLGDNWCCECGALIKDK